MVNKIINKFIKVHNPNKEYSDWNKKKVKEFIKLCVIVVRILALLYIVLSITNTKVAFSIGDCDITFQLISVIVVSSLVFGVAGINKFLCSSLMKFSDKCKSQVTIDTITVSDIKFFIEKNNIEI